MPSASRVPHSARHQPAPDVTHGFAEGRSGYSDNSTARTAHFGVANTTIGDPEGIAPCGPRSRRVAFGCHGWPLNPKVALGAQAQTWRTDLRPPPSNRYLVAMYSR